MKKTVSLILLLSMLVSQLSVFANAAVPAVNTKTQALNRIVELYENEKYEGGVLQNYSHIMLEYVETPQFTCSAINHTLKDVVKFDELVKFVANPLDYHNDYLEDMYEDHEDTARYILVCSINDAQTDILGSIDDQASAANTVLKLVGSYKKYFMSEEGASLLTYKREGLNDLFDQLGEKFPELVKNGQLEKLKKLYGESDYIKGVSTVAELEDLLEKIYVSVVVYKTNTVIAEEYMSRIPENSYLYATLSAFVQTTNNGFYNYFANKYLGDIVTDAAVNAIVEYLAYDNAYVKYAKGLLKGIDVARGVIFDFLIKSASIEDQDVFLNLQSYRNEFTRLLLTDERANDVKYSLSYDEALEFAEDYYVFLTLTENTLEKAKNMAKYIDTYDTYSVTYDMARCATIKAELKECMAVLCGSSPDGENQELGKPVYNCEWLEDGVYYIVSAVNDGTHALDVTGQRKDDGANIHLWTRHAGDSQKFYVKNISFNSYSITNVNSGKSLDVSGQSKKSGANVHQWTTHGGDSQGWTILRTSDDTTTYSIYNNNSFKYLDVSGGKAGNGTNIQVYTGNKTKAQKWIFYKVEDESYKPQAPEQSNKKWSDWSEWSTTKVNASDTVKVESKTQYGYYHYLMTWKADERTGSYPLPMREMQQCYPTAPLKNEEYHEIWVDEEIPREKYDVTYYNYTTKQRKTFRSYTNTHCSSRINAMNRLYSLGTRTVYRYKTYE